MSTRGPIPVPPKRYASRSLRDVLVASIGASHTREEIGLDLLPRYLRIFPQGTGTSAAKLTENQALAALNVTSNVTEDDLKKKMRSLMLWYHPDKWKEFRLKEEGMATSIVI